MIEQSASPLSATVLKVAHHGSAYASGPQWLRAVGATLAIVSVGVANEYGHPDATTLGRIEASGALVFRTDEDGDVVMATDGRAVQVTTTRLRPARPGGN